MTVVLLGGIKSLETHYREKARGKGVRLKVFNRSAPGITKIMTMADGLVLFTGEVSHNDARRAALIARNNHLPLVRSHTSSLNALKKSIDVLLDVRQVHRRLDMRGKRHADQSNPPD